MEEEKDKHRGGVAMRGSGGSRESPGSRPGPTPALLGAPSAKQGWAPKLHSSLSFAGEEVRTLARTRGPATEPTQPRDLPWPLPQHPRAPQTLQPQPGNPLRGPESVPPSACSAHPPTTSSLSRCSSRPQNPEVPQSEMPPAQANSPQALQVAG